MQGATGSALLTNIAITIIGIILVLFAASFAYSKAYKTKSIIIDVIEQHAGDVTEAIPDINEQLSNIGYERVNRKCANKHNRTETVYPTGTNKGQGYCIYKISEEYGGNVTNYYEVETYMHFDIPLIGFTIPVYGQTISFRDTMVNIEDDLYD